jgi:hypothetical protein
MLHTSHVRKVDEAQATFLQSKKKKPVKLFLHDEGHLTPCEAGKTIESATFRRCAVSPKIAYVEMNEWEGARGIVAVDDVSEGDVLGIIRVEHQLASDQAWLGVPALSRSVVRRWVERNDAAKPVATRGAARGGKKKGQKRKKAGSGNVVDDEAARAEYLLELAETPLGNPVVLPPSPELDAALIHAKIDREATAGAIDGAFSADGPWSQLSREERHRWACIVQSRCFGDPPVMLPFADMFNAVAADKNTVKIVPLSEVSGEQGKGARKGDRAVVATTDVPRGVQLFNTFGAIPNHGLFSFYGFVSPVSNAYDVIEVKAVDDEELYEEDSASIEFDGTLQISRQQLEKIMLTASLDMGADDIDDGAFELLSLIDREALLAQVSAERPLAVAMAPLKEGADPSFPVYCCAVIECMRIAMLHDLVEVLRVVEEARTFNEDHW